MIKVTLIGFLTDEPKSRKVGNSTAADFRMACRSNRKDKNGEYITNFFGCTSFGVQADYILKNGHKGKKLTVVGDQVEMEYEKKDGTTGHSIAVTVDSADFAVIDKDTAGTQRRAPQATTVPDYDGAENPF